MVLGNVKEFLRDAPSVSPLLPSQVELMGILAEGGQGVVFRGKVDQEPAAIKVYFPGQLHKRVEREVEALGVLCSPNLVRLLWHGSISIQDLQLPVVATSLIDGTDLDSRIRDQSLSNSELGHLAFDVASAIDHIWEKRIVHRDLKPSNIMLMRDGHACVIDLGLARHVDMSSLTMLGATWGTYGYLSPEQTRGVRQLTCKSDVYALGIILVQSSLGRHPTYGDQLRLLALNLHENLPPEISKWKHAELVKDMLHPRPTKRPMPTTIMTDLEEYSTKQP